MLKYRLDPSARLFSEFPWMWAVHPGYSPELWVCVKEFEGECLLLPIGADTSWWGVLKAGNDTMFLRKIDARPTERLADAVTRVFELQSFFARSPYVEITHLISKSTRNNYYIIHRPRRNYVITDAVRSRVSA